jgi:hypothetical protein
MFNLRKVMITTLFAMATGATGAAAGANCDWRDGMVDLDRCPAVRASIDDEPLDGADAQPLGCEDALGAVLDALWTDPLNPMAFRALDAVVVDCRADFLLRADRESAHLHD